MSLLKAVGVEVLVALRLRIGDHCHLLGREDIGTARARFKLLEVTRIELWTPVIRPLGLHDHRHQKRTALERSEGRKHSTSPLYKFYHSSVGTSVVR